MPSHLGKRSWPQHQQQEDWNYGAECYQRTANPDWQWRTWDRFTYLGSIIIEMEELTWTSRAVSIWWIKYGAPPLTVLVSSWTSITAASWQLSCIVQNVAAWRRRTYQKLSKFHTKSPRRILRIFLRNVISNKDLFERCGTETMATILKRRSW